MLVTLAFAQGAAGGGDAATATIMNLAPLVLIVIVFYFLLIRPQQKRMKAHQEMIGAVKRGDTVVTAGGLIGKVKSVHEDEVRLELAPNVEVRAVRSTISDVRNKGEPAPANDTKASTD